MAIYNVHGGHNYHVTGANGYFSETDEDRKVKDLIISKLRALGNTVYDTTDNSGTTQSQNLRNIVANCNSHKVDLDISIHFNASNGQGHGTEVLLFGNGNHRTIGEHIVNEIAALGFKNRGVKDGSGLYVVRYTNAPAILIECCFCDNAEDARIYNAEKMATAIVKGITGKTINNNNNQEKKEEPKKSGYRIERHERIVECITDGLNRRKEPTTNSSIVGTENKGFENRIVNKCNNEGVIWLQDCAGYWISSNYCKDVIYTCISSELNRRDNPSFNSKVVGVDHRGSSHRIKEYSNKDGVKWARDIAGYWFSTSNKYMNKTLEPCKF